MIAVAAMAVPVSASSYFVSSCTITRQAVCSVSSSSCCSSSGAIYWPKTSALYISSSPFASWSGLKGLSMSRSVKSGQTGRKRRRRGMVVYASLFGVGAPEALVIGVVALLVFGPKGLAEVARNLGKTLRAFQPTIRELQDVSREFKSTLEREIGLDELSAQNTYNVNRSNPTSSPSTITREQAPEPVVDPNGATSSPQAYSSEEYLKVTEEQLKAVASQQSEQPEQATSSGETSAERPETQSKPQVDETPSTTPPSVKSESGT